MELYVAQHRHQHQRLDEMCDGRSASTYGVSEMCGVSLITTNKGDEETEKKE